MRDALDKHLCTRKAREAETWRISSLKKRKRECRRTRGTQGQVLTYSGDTAGSQFSSGLSAGGPQGCSIFSIRAEADSLRFLILGNGEVVEKIEVAHVGAVGGRGAGSPAIPTSWCHVAGPDVRTADALAGCEWCSGPSCHRFSAFAPQVRGSRLQERRSGLQAGLRNLGTHAVAGGWRHSNEAAQIRDPRSQRRKQV